MKGFLFITFFIKAVYNTALHGEFELNPGENNHVGESYCAGVENSVLWGN